jgi:hypothetical protein
MPNPNAIVSRHIRLQSPPERTAAEAVRAEGGLSVELDDGRSVRLDPENPRSAGFAQVLEGLEKLGRPVYLEVDPETEAVTRLLIPLVGRVNGLTPVEAGLEVGFDPSHARHLLRRDAPDFAATEAVLREALERRTPILLTDDDAQEIVDVRFFRPGPDDGPRLFPEGDFRAVRPSAFLALIWWIWYWPIWPWWWFWYRCVSFATAKQAFDAMKATSCAPLTVPPPCIPFLYPDNGCWARAHEMCRLMIAMGLSPRKVWIMGSLQAATRNRKNCQVNWAWHVAPTLCVRCRPWWLWFWTHRMVIDPSLTDGPVTVAYWKGLQGDPGATLTYTAAADYYWGSTDPGYTQTNIDLATYRLALQNRSNGPDGPPPYANCP